MLYVIVLYVVVYIVLYVIVCVYIYIYIYIYIILYKNKYLINISKTKSNKNRLNFKLKIFLI